MHIPSVHSVCVPRWKMHRWRVHLWPELNQLCLSGERTHKILLHDHCHITNSSWSTRYTAAVRADKVLLPVSVDKHSWALTWWSISSHRWLETQAPGSKYQIQMSRPLSCLFSMDVLLNWSISSPVCNSGLQWVMIDTTWVTGHIAMCRTHSKWSIP